jgi:branched-chain amino acid transport system ATP-binding protein
VPCSPPPCSAACRYRRHVELTGPASLLGASHKPSLGLAPRAVTEVVDALAALAGGAAGPPTTVVLVEQNAHAAFAVAGRGYPLDRGAVAVAGPTDRLRRDPGVQAAYRGAPPTR